MPDVAMFHTSMVILVNIFHHFQNYVNIRTRIVFLIFDFAFSPVYISAGVLRTYLKKVNTDRFIIQGISWYLGIISYIYNL